MKWKKTAFARLILVKNKHRRQSKYRGGYTMSNAVVFTDYYLMLGLDRTKSSQELIEMIDQKMDEDKVIDKLEGITQVSSSKDRDYLEKLAEGMFYFRDLLMSSQKRTAYDLELDNAYNNGLVNSEKEAEAADAVTAARVYFEHLKFEMAMRYAKDALDNSNNQIDAFIILAKCYYMLGDYQASLDTIHDALSFHPHNEELNWMFVRYRINMGMFDAALKHLDEYVNQNQYDMRMKAEYTYLLLCQDRIEEAKAEAVRLGFFSPDDMKEKEYDRFVHFEKIAKPLHFYIGQNFITYSERFLMYSRKLGQKVITEKEQYEKILSLRQHAYFFAKFPYGLVSSNDDDDIPELQPFEEAIDEVLFWDEVVYDEENDKSIKTLRIVSISALVISLFFLSDSSNKAIGLIILLAGLAILGYSIIMKRTSHMKRYQYAKKILTGVRTRSQGIIGGIANGIIEFIKDALSI